MPETPVVIDHFSRIGVSGTIEQTDLDNLLRLADFDTVYVKTSAFYALGEKKAPYLDLGPMIRQVRDAYGAERLMWATDCPFQVQNGHTYGESIALVRQEWARMAEHGPSEAELRAAKTFLTGSYPLRQSSSGRIARMLLGIQMENLGIDYINRRNDLIEAVTIEDAKRVAKRVYDEGLLTFVVVGQPAGVNPTRPAPEGS